MKINDIFEKEIARKIEGVVKADDLDELALEIEEYVVTAEIEHNLSRFLSSYLVKNQTNTGVWISGFFGSGKSHLLKMLAYLLENKAINGKSIADIITQKLPPSDAMLKADIQRASKIPSASILFNIDQKVDATLSDDKESIVVVFQKVFDEFLGFYGKVGYIARFERELEANQLFDEFKQAFQTATNRPWEIARESFSLYRDQISKAYAKVTKNSEETSLDVVKGFREAYSLSVEDFAKSVKAYIDTQEPGFRLNFFVDEIGQFIAENTSRMLNLQTIAETLSSVCNGQAWLFVTSQDDMTRVFGGNLTDRKANDFTKIMDRFSTRILLDSKDVAEVIQKRLLEKKSDAKLELLKLHEKNQNSFSIFFKFPDKSSTYPLFKSAEDFVETYPFIPYHFSLFHEAMIALSQHDAFIGKHGSVGQRSMLGVFQAEAIRIKGQELGTLGTFDHFYEGIRDSVQTLTQSSINKAEANLADDPLAIRVLKALFLVKYIPSFAATPRNLRVLLQSSLTENIEDLEKRVQASLDRLERETYIQRGEVGYEFLTKKEQDIENEIKQLPVTTDQLLGRLNDFFFGEILKANNKLRFDKSSQDYSFTKKIDGTNFGQSHELSIEFLSPIYSGDRDLNVIFSHSLSLPQLIFLLPEDESFVRDLQLYIKTDQYVLQHNRSGASSEVKAILQSKSELNISRKAKLALQARELISNARVIVSGEEQELKSTEAWQRINEAFNVLIEKTHTNLDMVSGLKCAESDLGELLEPKQLSYMDTSTPTEAENEILIEIQNAQFRGSRPKMSDLKTKFTSRPYGWSMNAIQCLVATLLGKRKIEAYKSGSLLSTADLKSNLLNTYGYENLSFEPLKDIPADVLRKWKNFYSDFFGQPPETNPAKLLDAMKAAFEGLFAEIQRYQGHHARYPFVDSVTSKQGRWNVFPNREEIISPVHFYLKQMP